MCSVGGYRQTWPADGQLHPCQYPALIGTFIHVDAKFTTSTMLQTRHRQGRPPRCRLDVSQPAQLLAARRDNLIRPYCRCATHCPPTPTTNMTPQENGLLSYLQNCKTMLALRRHRSWTSTGWALKSMHQSVRYKTMSTIVIKRVLNI